MHHSDGLSDHENSTMSTLPIPDVRAEHAVLLRHWAGVQDRVSRQACQQAQRCAELEAELLRLRARWVLTTTRMLWGMGWPGLETAHHALAGNAAPTTTVPVTASQVLCQSGCAGHAHPWLDNEGHCRLTGQDCTRVPSGLDAVSGLTHDGNIGF